MRGAAVVISLVFAVIASALSPDRTIAQFHHTAWTAKDGAPSQVSALAQTSDGVLWIGSAVGLFRFDGVHFEKFAPRDDTKLPSHNIYALMATPDGGLWVSFRPSGLGFIKEGRLTIFDALRGHVNAFARGRDGRIWAATSSGLGELTGKQWRVMHPELHVRKLLVDREGTLWAATREKIYALRRGASTLEIAAEWRDVTTLVEAPNGDIWANEHAQSMRRVRARPGDRVALEVNPLEMLIDRDGTFWMIHIGLGITRMRQPEQAPNRVIRDVEPWFDPYTQRNGLTSDVVSCLFEDREGNIWAGTAKGLDRFRYSHIVPVPLPPLLLKVTLAADADGAIWVASSVIDDMARIRRGVVEKVDVPLVASSVYTDPRGVRWWGSAGGIMRQQGERFEAFRQPRDLPDDYAWEVVRDEDGDGVLVRLGDVWPVHFKDGVWSRRSPPPGLIDRGPSATFHDSAGRTWFGYTENRVAILDRGRATMYTRDDGIDVGRIRVIRGRTGPHYWIGGELGLSVFRDGTFRSVVARDGARFGTVSGIIETADGAVWLNEMRGIVRIAPDEARKVVANPAHRIAYQLFDFQDGLPGSPQMNFTASTAVEGSDGVLWFATDNGLARIDPARLQTNSVPPPIAIQSCIADRAYAPAAELRFPVGTRQFEIRYTALSLSIPERVKFRYKLEGADDDWQDAGTRREAFYTNLGPGTYTFRVRAANNDGVWNEAGTSMSIVIPPAFHQTKWFLIVCIAIAALIVWLIFLLRMRQMTARLQRLHEERMDERTRIARELHDTLLQGFLSASMQLHVAADRLEDASPAKPIINNVLGLVAKVTEEGRQAVRGLRLAESSESLEQAFGRVRQEVAREREVGFRVIAEGKRRRVRPEVRDEIYRIGREALVNAFQHADAKNVEVEVEYLDDRFRLRVRDDGRGINETLLHARREDHWGLAGMHERAQKIGGQFRVTSRSGAGTEIELSVPRRIAYARN